MRQENLLNQQGNLLQKQADLLQQQTASTQKQAELLQSQSNLLQQQINPSQQHVSIRQFMAYSQLAQIDEDRVLIIGDSIIEGWFNEDLGQCKVLNIGFGSGTVSDVLAFLDGLEENLDLKDVRSHIKSTVIAIGVNDTKRRESLPENYVEEWSKSYEEMLSKALEMGLGKVYVSTILPVEKGRSLGDLYFDPILIESLNNSIRSIAQQKNVELVDSSAYFVKASQDGANSFTVDGVHLDPEGYQILDSAIAQSLEACSLGN